MEYVTSLLKHGMENKCDNKTVGTASHVKCHMSHVTCTVRDSTKLPICPSCDRGHFHKYDQMVVIATADGKLKLIL